ncbi:hypothetical protein B0T25DRAFT_578960 [Lasiosphaeria hispida]|uniref:Uncharacterized protein n=1 Tax=Lasiosphaeria hispida TaxID=260671 RepID=A0AAJ0HLJ8_9PEZI|nr:hypothetical protein B0T25DRAFT_578960 [Lasiosphaeria hispida]
MDPNEPNTPPQTLESDMVSSLLDALLATSRELNAASASATASATASASANPAAAPSASPNDNLATGQIWDIMSPEVLNPRVANHPVDISSNTPWANYTPAAHQSRLPRRHNGTYFVFHRDWPGARTPGRRMDMTMHSNAVDLVFDWLLVKGVDEHKLIAEVKQSIKLSRPGGWSMEERRWYEAVYVVLDERIRAQKLQQTLRELREEEEQELKGGTE